MNRTHSRALLLSSVSAALFSFGASAQPVEEVVVTGSHIRGVAPVGSSLIAVGSDDFRKTGAVETTDLLRSIPQVMNLGWSEVTQAGGSRQGGAQSNTTLTRSINLRGLGPTVTLTLFNGQRIATGSVGDATDIDSYPSGLVQRIEVVADGGSATYGSDAVAGTVNVILREPTDIVQSSMLMGFKKYGFDWTAEQILGTTWGKEETGLGDGGLIVVFQHSHTDSGFISDFAEFYNDDLSPYIGATGQMPDFANPGNVTGLGGAAGTAALYAIPAGIAPTQRLLLSQLGPANAPNRESQWTNTTPIPQRVRDTVAGHFKQELADWLTFWTHGFYFERDGFGVNGSVPVEQLNISVPATNPYTPCAPGVSAANTQGLTCPANNTITVRYSFADETGGTNRVFYQEDFGFTYGFDVSLPYEWALKASGHFSKGYNDTWVTPRVNTTALAQVVSGTGKPANVPFFNPFCDSSCNDRLTLDYINGRTNWNASQNTYESYKAIFDGPLFDLPGGSARLAVGGTYERASLNIAAYTTTTAAIGVQVRQGGSFNRRTIRSLFGEFYVPLVGDANAMPGIQKLELTLAGRITDYSDFGTTKNPKIGVNWKPVGDLTIHGSWGTSFRAPTLRDIDPLATVGQTASNTTCGGLAGINLAACPAGATTPLSMLVGFGGNARVRPETADTWSIGGDWNPESVPGLQTSLTYYNIVHKNRIEAIGANVGALAAANGGIYDSIITFNPLYWGARAVVTEATAEFVPGLTVGAPLTQAQFNAYRAARDAVGAPAATVNPLALFVDGRRINSGTLETDGLDFTARYDWDMDWGSAQVGATGNYVLSYKTQVLPGAPVNERVNIFGHQPRFRARFDAGVTHDKWTVTAYLNYTNSYEALASQIPLAAPASFQKIDADMTVDLSVSYNTGEDVGVPLLRNIGLNFGVTNLFDKDPPFFLNGGAAPAILYDPQSANVFGRFFTLRVTKAW